MKSEDLLKEGLRKNSPRKDKEAYKLTVNLLDKHLKEPDVFHVGLIGSYGSGKSSAIRTFLDNKENDKKSIVVSLTEYGVENYYSDTIHFESILLQQILFSVTKDDVPDSRIRRIGIRKRAWATFAIGLMFAALVCLFIFRIVPVVLYQSFVASAIAAGILFLYFLFSTFPVSFKAKYKGIEIDALPNSNETLFDDYLDELIYFFRQTNKRYVFFEDIDRCECANELFSRLYTLNKTLNNTPYFKDDPIKFVYGVKEDAFISSEQKSKFFDIMISIPPILTSDNAAERFREALTSDEKDIFDVPFIKGLVRYVSFYRQLNNIINSYRIFSADKDYTIENHKELMALMVYKSLYPKDYKDFVIGKGLLFWLVNSESNTFESYIEQNHINEIDKEALKEIDNFHDDFKSLITKNAISYISSFSAEFFKTPEARDFYTKIDLNVNRFDYEIMYKDPSAIFDYDNVLDYIGKPLFLNISLLKYLYQNDEKYAEAISSIIKNVSLDSDVYKNFIILVFSKYLKENWSDWFLEKLFEKNIHLVALLKEKAILNSEIMGYIFEKFITTLDVLEKENVDNCIVKVFAQDYSIQKTLNLIGEDLAEYLINTSLIKINNLDSISQKDSKQNILLQIIKSFSFEINKSNLEFLGKYCSSNLTDYFSTIIGRFGFDFVKTLINKCIDQEDPGIFEFVNSYSGETSEAINYLIGGISFIQQEKDKIYETCVPFVPDEDYAIKTADLYKLLSKQKIKGTISLFFNIKNKIDNAGLVFDFNEYIFNNPDYLIESVNKEEIPPMLISLLNSQHANHDNVGTILHKTIKNSLISISSLKKQEVAICCIEYKYAIFDTGLIDFCNVNYSLISRFMVNNYFDEIIKLQTTNVFSSDFISEFLLFCSDAQKIVAVNHFEPQIIPNLFKFSSLKIFVLTHYEKFSPLLILSFILLFDDQQQQFKFFCESYFYIRSAGNITNILSSIFDKNTKMYYYSNDYNFLKDLSNAFNSDFHGKFNSKVYSKDTHLVLSKI